MRKYFPDPNSFRLFIGIYLPDDFHTYFKDAIRFFDKEKRNLKNIPIDQIHLTMKFIGATVSRNSKDILVNKFKSLEGQFAKPEIKLGDVQFGFPYQHDPRVLMMNVQESDTLTMLMDQIHDVVKNLRLRDTIRWKDKNSKSLHVTLSRLKPSATRSTGNQVKDILKNFKNQELPSFFPEEMYLLQSDMTTSGPTYKQLAKIRL